MLNPILVLGITQNYVIKPCFMELAFFLTSEVKRAQQFL